MIRSRTHSCYRSLLALTAAVALVAAGCGGDASPTSPNFPPTTGGGSFGSQSTSAVSGQVVGGGGGAALSSEAFGGAPAAGAMGGIQVSVQGTGLTTTTDGDGKFVLLNVPDGTVVLLFSGLGLNATVTLQGVGANTLVQITVQVDEDSATIIEQLIESLDVEELELHFSRDKWSLGWIDNGSSGAGNSAIEAYIDDGPFILIDPESIEMEGPDGLVIPFTTGFRTHDGFVARFTKAQVISVAVGVPPGTTTEVVVRGALLDGTPFQLFADIEIVDDDDDGDEEEDGGNKIDEAVAAQAIADLEIAIDYLEELVDTGAMAANSANPLIKKLESAIDKLEKLNGLPAANQLGAFLNQLDAFEKTGKISSDDADFLAGLVGDVIDLIRSGD